MNLSTQPNHDRKRKRVALGMSGGVDSSLCAHLLTERGYDVTGVYLECWKAPGCRTDEDRKDALKVALSLNVPFQVLDFKQQYRDRVVEYFFEEYEAGRTPNPDVMCNKEIKFGLFYDWAMEQGFDSVATGHYAKIIETRSDSGKIIPRLTIPHDRFKDQTYFLYLLKQEQLEHTVFPLGEFTKAQVRTEAKKRNIHVSNKKDSVGICFIGDINVHEFLRERLGENPGDVVDTAGNRIGSHQGLWFYTIGQRSGFSIETKTVIKQDDGTLVDKHTIPPFYVIDKKPDENQLVVGFGAETLKDKFQIENMHWIGHEPTGNFHDVLVRIRHTGELLECRLIEKLQGWEIHLDEPVKGIASGQSAVIYAKFAKEILCLGGGIINVVS